MPAGSGFRPPHLIIVRFARRDESFVRAEFLSVAQSRHFEAVQFTFARDMAILAMSGCSADLEQHSAAAVSLAAGGFVCNARWGERYNFNSGFSSKLPIDVVGKCARGHGLLPPNSIIGGILYPHEPFLRMLDPSCLALQRTTRTKLASGAPALRLLEFRMTNFGSCLANFDSSFCPVLPRDVARECASSPPPFAPLTYWQNPLPA